MSRVLFSTMSRMYSTASGAMVIFFCLKKPVTQPCFWFSNISQKIFWSAKGMAPAVFFFESPVSFLSISPVSPGLTSRSVASGAGLFM